MIFRFIITDPDGFRFVLVFLSVVLTHNTFTSSEIQKDLDVDVDVVVAARSRSRTRTYF